MVPAKVRVPAAEALPRERLESQLAAAVERHRLTLVIAPAGSGKTTLLARFAASTPLPVAWYRAETWDDDPARMLRHLEAALGAVLPGLHTGWADVEDAARALEEGPGGEAILVIDDLHALEGTAAEAVLSRLVDYAPPWLRMVAASRVRPDFNLPRLRVSGDLAEIQGDDLRFRAWEVERLFRDFYREPVPPSELAVLARRTEGWAAGLQLFHLATRGKSADERRRILGGVGSGTRVLREYLARNVLAALPEELRRFLVDTCVLPRLTGDLCDELLNRRGSALLLEELARRQLFTVAIDENEGSYRYHEVLRSHLDRMLVEEVGEVEARRRHQRAAQLLERGGALPEALVGFCRAEDWPAVSSLVGDRGEQVAGGPGLRLELLPAAVVRDSPWLALASARRARAEGRWSAALEAYARAEQAFGASSAAATSRRERQALAAWLDPVAIPPADWTGVLRTGLIREPLAAARDPRLDLEHRDLVRGLLLLAAGEVSEARRALLAASQREELEPTLGAAAAVGAAVAALLSGEKDADRQLADAIDIAERIGLPWLARMGRVAERLTGADSDAVRFAHPGRDQEADPWGALLALLVDAWIAAPLTAAAGVPASATPAERRVHAAEQAAGIARRLGAGVLEAFARGIAAYGLTEAGAPEARDAALAVESLARATGTAGPRLLAYAALADPRSSRGAEYADLVESVQRDTGLSLPPETAGDAAAREEVRAAEPSMVRDSTPPDADRNGASKPANGHAAVVVDDTVELAALPRPALDIRVFGAFTIEVDGTAIPLDRVKPRARAVLRFLAVRPGVPIHREVIQEALWPDVDSATGARSLHVAVSAVRGLLTEALGRDSSRMIAREGDAYRLAVDPMQVDVGRFERAMARARAARSGSDPAAGAAGFAEALALYRGDLLPQDGPAEWAVERREHFRREAVEAATIIAEDALAAGELEEAIRVCRRGLELDRFHDPLWRVLIGARELAGDAGAASRDRREYASILEGLGLGTEARASSA